MTRKTLLNLFRNERGIALPVALAVLSLTAGLATVAARTAIVSQHQSQRDRYAKSAIQASSSGIQAAIYQTNLLAPGNTQCVVKNATTGALSNATVQSDGYCTPLTETLGDNASYSVRVSQVTQVTVNGQRLAERQIVSTGTVNGVVRRSTVTVDASIGNPLFPLNFAMVARDAVTFKNDATFTNGGIGSNGNITFKNNTSVCGPVTPGPGKVLNTGNNFSQCAGFTSAPATQPFPFQPVDMTGPNATNDNARITNAKAGSGTPTDTCSTCVKVVWNASTRVLTIQSGGILTLTGSTYAFCRLDVQSGGQLKISARTTPLLVYIDTPANCGGSAGMGSAALNGSVLNVNSNPATFTMLVAGSATVATSVAVDDNYVNALSAPMSIYAPNSSVDFKNNLDWKGSLVAKTITMKNNATITYDSRVTDLELGNAQRFYESQAYKECTNIAPTSTPTSGC